MKNQLEADLIFMQVSGTMGRLSREPSWSESHLWKNILKCCGVF